MADETVTASLKGMVLQAKTLIFELVVAAKASASVLYGLAIVPSGVTTVESARTKMAQVSRMLPTLLVAVSMGTEGSPLHSAGGGGPFPLSPPVPVLASGVPGHP